MCICRKGETLTVSIFENIGLQIFKLLPKNNGNRSDLSARPVYNDVVKYESLINNNKVFIDASWNSL